MIDWATIEPGLYPIIKSISGATIVCGRDEKRPAVSGKNSIALVSPPTIRAYASGFDATMDQDPPIALSGTVSVTHGSANVVFSQPQSLFADGGRLEFASQLGTLYVLSADLQNATAGVLTAPFTGPTTAADTCTFTSDLLYETLTEVDYVTFRIEVNAYDQRPGKTARQMLEAMRVRWWHLSTTLALQAIGLNYCDMSATQPLTPSTVDGHVISKAAADVTFIVMTDDTDRANPVPPIDSVETIPNLS